jgi:transposase, IS5 family
LAVNSKEACDFRFRFCELAKHDCLSAAEGTMLPRQHQTTGSSDLFRARLDQIIDMKHALVLRAAMIDWAWIDAEIAPLYSENGRPGIEARFAIGLLILKHIYGLSDEGVCERWVHDPYFQYFTAEEFFQHGFPHERSDLSHWRKRFASKLDLLLSESLRVAHEAGALGTKDMARVTVDTTVQPKNVTFPTDAKLNHAAIKGLNRLAKKRGLKLRQSYLRLAKRAAMMARRYAHAKQFRRHKRELRFLRTRLGRLIRDIGRRIKGKQALEKAFAAPLAFARQIQSQEQRQRGWKLYSSHAPETECIGKGKASAPYEFGVKVSIVTTNRRTPGGQFVLQPRRCLEIPMTVTRYGLLLKKPKSSPAARSSASMPIRAIAATTPQSRAACSSQAKSAGCSALSNAN